MTSPALLIVPGSIAAVLRVTGEDVFAYLQSQFSNDLRRPETKRPVTYGLWLTRKGKVAADSLVVRLAPEDFLLLSFYTPADKLSEKVLENVIADDVAAEPVACAGITIAGEGAGAALAGLGFPVPAPGEWAEAEGVFIIASRRGGESFELVSPDDGAFSRFTGRIQHLFTPEGAGALEALRVVSGIPRVPEDCGPGDLPQEAGLDAGAVSFDKGCYLGQEVMARLQSQGRPTRTLTRLRLPAGTGSPPAKLYAGEQEAGEIRSGAIVHRHWEAMTMLKNRVTEGVESFALTPGGEPVATRIAAL